MSVAASHTLFDIAPEYPELVMYLRLREFNEGTTTYQCQQALIQPKAIIDPEIIAVLTVAFKAMTESYGLWLELQAVLGSIKATLKLSPDYVVPPELQYKPNHLDAISPIADRWMIEGATVYAQRLLRWLHGETRPFQDLTPEQLMERRDIFLDNKSLWINRAKALNIPLESVLNEREIELLRAHFKTSSLLLNPATLGRREIVMGKLIRAVKPVWDRHKRSTANDTNTTP